MRKYRLHHQRCTKANLEDKCELDYIYLQWNRK
jgi:hypothetical protein